MTAVSITFTESQIITWAQVKARQYFPAGQAAQEERIMPQSAADKLLLDRIENDFTYHLPSKEQAMLYSNLRDEIKQVAQLIVEIVPDGRERSIVLTKLEEAVMWANAGIARQKLEP